MGLPKRDNERFREAALDQMVRAGMPLERVRGVKGRERAITHLYHMPNGQTVRLRTNTKARAVMSKADGFDANDAIHIEGQQDFLLVAVPGPDDTVDCALLPSEQTIAYLREAHRDWQEIQTNGRGKSDVRIIHFDEKPQRQGHSFGWFFEQHRIKPAADAPAAPLSARLHPNRVELERAVTKAKREIAPIAGVPESAVSISITY
jgi:hypothetical protein